MHHRAHRPLQPATRNDVRCVRVHSITQYDQLSIWFRIKESADRIKLLSAALRNVTSYEGKRITFFVD